MIPSLQHELANARRQAMLDEASRRHRAVAAVRARERDAPRRGPTSHAARIRALACAALAVVRHARPIAAGQQ